MPSNTTTSFIETYHRLWQKDSARSRYRERNWKKGRRSSRRVRLDSAFGWNTYWYEENREPPFRLTQQTSQAFGSKGYVGRYHGRVEVGGYYQERRPIEPFESNFEETTKLPLQWSKDRVPWQTLAGKGNNIVDRSKIERIKQSFATGSSITDIYISYLVIFPTCSLERWILKGLLSMMKISTHCYKMIFLLTEI